MVLHSMADRSAQAARSFDDAAGSVEESLSIFQEMGSTHKSAHALSELGRIMRRQAQTEEAREVLDTALELLRKVGDQRCTSEL
jgi:TolA-binding protein